MAKLFCIISAICVLGEIDIPNEGREMSALIKSERIYLLSLTGSCEASRAIARRR